MDSKISRKFCFVFNTLLLSTTGVLAQDGNFYKQLLKESMKETMKETMKPQTTDIGPSKNDHNEKTIKVEVDPEKIKIPMFVSFNHSLDSFKNKVMEKTLKEKDMLVISPGFFIPKELPFDAYYDDTPVFTDGKWVPKSALPGGGIGPMTIIALLFNTGIVKYDPLPATKSKKEKALERLREIYNSGTKEGKWDGDVTKLNDASNRLREEVAKEEEEKKQKANTSK